MLGAREWLDERLTGPEPLGLPWPSSAWGQVKEWLGCRASWIPAPTERHRDILERLLLRSVQRSDLVPDAHLAALAVEHGLILCSTDGDFARFADLRWENPLA